MQLPDSFEMYQPLEVSIWFSYNFILFVDTMSDVITGITLRQVVVLSSHQLLPYNNKQNN